MTADPIVRRVHEQFVAAEESAWNHLPERERDLARYTWERWYRPGVQTIARLLARAARVSTADELVGELGGTGQLAHRFTEAAVTAGVLEIGSDGSLQWRLPEPFRYRPVDLEPPPPYGELGQLPCDQSGRHRIGELVLADLPWGGAVLLLGDDDLVAPGLAASGLYTTVLDLDGRLGPLLAGAGVGFRHGDVRRLPAELTGRFDAVVCDPADNSVALLPWLRAAAAALTDQPGARVYLSLAPARIGHRWAALVADALRLDLVPCGHTARCKEYQRDGRVIATTDCWALERTPQLSSLPLPYLDVETVR